ncbi:unnamed protein product [Schistosoma mattheei]|uniref:Uncharacterized protein n=1 Tax=Schistosoma mattheei TaxID=31246 RepID=A0A3P8G3S9_9TREM|nr:unnamed protein product [Schistosoma mattheei]
MFLTNRQFRVRTRYHCIIALWQFCNEFMSISQFRCFYNTVFIIIIVS